MNRATTYREPPAEARRFWLQYAISMYSDFPQTFCGIRSCRRVGLCGFWETESNRPTCITRLSDDAMVMATSLLTDILFAIHDGTHPTKPSDNPAGRALEALAIDIMNYALPQFPDAAERFQTWRAKYEAPPAPPPPPAPIIDAGAMAREMRAELKRMGIAVEPPGR